MKLEKPQNDNYVATVVEIKKTFPLDNCDFIIGTNIFGFQAIVNKETKDGDIGIMFPAEVRLSNDFCKHNNLYRHGEFNKDKSQKGFIEDNRRVKAVKFRGHRSDCLFMPLSSLNWTKAKIDELKIGDSFDVLNKKEVCKKYIIKRPRSRTEMKLKKAFKRIDKAFLPEHYDSQQYFRIEDDIDGKQEIIVTQKLHGTSIRIGNTVVMRELNILEKFLKKIGFQMKEIEYDYVYGSRKVIKDANNPNHVHYYDEDIWTESGKKIIDSVPMGFILYGELIGWTSNGASIQKDYTYGIEHGTSEIYIYRIAQINGQGLLTDLSWDHVVEFCEKRGLKYVPEIWRGEKKNLKLNKYLDVKLNKKHRHCLDVGGDLVDEGICIRIDTMVPDIYKSKSPIFYQHETKMLDEEALDLEVEGSDEL